MTPSRPTPSSTIEDDVTTPTPRCTTTASPKARRRLSGSDSGSDEDDNSSTASDVVYPPVPEDHSETRKIEENLRKWDELERQRRRVTREAGQSRPLSSSSLVRTASRTASMLIGSGRWTRLPEAGGRRRDSSSSENVALEPLPQASTSTPPPSTAPASTRDPFADPSPSQHNTMHRSSSANTSLAIPTMDAASGLLSRPVFGPSSSSSSSSRSAAPDSPQPLNLPSPTTPPAHVWEDTPPPPVASPLVQRPINTEHQQEGRWWHEYLCGFGEGPDRGGDKQAGRTNPFE